MKSSLIKPETNSKETSISIIYNSIFKSFKHKKSAEVIIQKLHLIPLMKYITYELLNTGTLDKKDFKVIHYIIQKADEQLVYMDNFMLEYLINICCLLLLKESHSLSNNTPTDKQSKVEKDHIRSTELLIEILKIAMKHFTEVSDMLVMKIMFVSIVVQKYTQLKIVLDIDNYERSSIIMLIDLLTISQEKVNQLIESFKDVLFLNQNRYTILAYICYYDNNKIQSIIERNNNLVKSILQFIKEEELNIEQIYKCEKHILDILKLHFYKGSLQNNKTRSLYDMNYLLKKIEIFPKKDTDKISNIISFIIQCFGKHLSHQWTNIFNILKSIINDLNKFDSAIILIISLYNEHNYYGSFKQFEDIILNDLLTGQNLDITYQKDKIDFVFGNIQKFITNYPQIIKFYIEKITKETSISYTNTINHIFYYLNLYYKLYSDIANYEGQLNNLIINNYIPLCNQIITLSQDKAMSYIISWKTILCHLLLMTSSQEIIQKSLNAIFENSLFKTESQLHVIRIFIGKAFDYSEFFRVVLFNQCFLYKLLDLTHKNPPSICLNDRINVAIKYLIYIYINKEGLITYTQSNMNFVKPKVNVKLFGNKKNEYLCDVKLILIYFTSLLSKKNKLVFDRKLIWNFLIKKAKNNIFFFKSQHSELIYSIIKSQTNELDTKYNTNGIIHILDFIYIINDVIVENDSFIFNGMNPQQQIITNFICKIMESLVNDIKNNDKIDLELFHYINQTLAHHISIMYKKQIESIDNINTIILNHIKQLFVLTSYIRNSKQYLNTFAFSILTFISAIKDIITQNSKLIIFTVLLLSIFSFETYTDSFFNRFNKKFSISSQFILKNSANYINTQLKIAIDYLIFYILANAKDRQTTVKIISIYKKVFSKKSGNQNDKGIHLKVFKEFIRWSNIANLYARNSYTESVKNIIEQKANIVENFKYKEKHIVILTTKKNYALITRSPSTQIFFKFCDKNLDINTLFKMLANYFDPKVTHKESKKINKIPLEEDIKIIQNAYELKNLHKVISKNNNSIQKDHINYNSIAILDNIDIFRTFKVKFICYNDLLKPNDNNNIKYSKELNELLNGLSDRCDFEKDKQNQIKTIYYKDVINKIEINVEPFIQNQIINNEDQPLNNILHEEHFRTRYLNYVSIVYIEQYEDKKNLNELTAIFDERQEYKNQYYIFLLSENEGLYDVNFIMKDKPTSNKKQIYSFGNKVFFQTKNSISFFKQNLLEWIINLNIKEQYISSRENLSKDENTSTNSLINFSEFDNMYKRYHFIKEKI